MTQHSDWTIGIDLGDRVSEVCQLNRATGEIIEDRFAMTKKLLKERFSGISRCQVAIEVGCHSRWVKRELESLGFEVLVADPRRLALITKSHTKNDRNDARKLAELSAAGLGLLNPVHHRDDQMQADLSVAKARDALVRTRTMLINVVRGMVKASGHRVSSCSAPSFHCRKDEIAEELRPALWPLFDQLEGLTKQIRAYDRAIEKLCEERYPEVKPMMQVRGVSYLTALVVSLTLGDPSRFKRSRDVAAYFGLCPRQHESGAQKRELGITKCGDRHVRRLLVQSAHYILGPFGEDCDLRRWGENLVRRGGKCAKKRAAVAVARKLSVVLHRLRVDQSDYEPLRRKPAA